MFQHVVLTFERFDLEFGNNCTRDNVTVIDSVTGVHLMTRCGSNPPGDVISSSNRLTVVFRTDSSVTDSGFVIKYTSLTITPGEHAFELL